MCARSDEKILISSDMSEYITQNGVRITRLQTDFKVWIYVLAHPIYATDLNIGRHSKDKTVENKKLTCSWLMNRSIYRRFLHLLFGYYPEG